MMKPNLSIATGLRRLSSEKISENPFSAGNISPQTKTAQYLKGSYGDFQSKKQLGNSLKGLLSPVDYKLVEIQTKANALKLEEDTAKPSPKGSARLSGHIILNGTEQINEIYSKGSMHQKKKSFDSKVDSQYDDTQGSKTKLPNTNSLSHTRSQTSTNIYLKDVEYVVNPMFSPVNGPPKYITHRQSDSLVDSVSPKMSQAKKTSAAQDGKTGHKMQENADIMLKKESHSAKMLAKSSLNQFFETKKSIEEGSLDEYQAATKAKAIKEKGSQLPLNKMKDGKKSPSMNVSPRVEAYNSLHAYTATNGVKPVGGEFENFQIVKNKSSLGSLYSRQREENQESTAKGTTAVKSSPKKSVSKGVKKDCFFPKSKQTDAATMQNKVKKSEIDLKEENEDMHVRPRTTKHSEPNIQKDINNFIFSGFNSQMKRNSAAQIYNSASLVESNLQSTRSAVDRSEKQTFIKEDQKSAKGVGTKPTSAAEVDVKLTSESNGEDGHTLSKKNSVGQIPQNPNAKFLIMRKQVQEKRANRGFKSAGQDIFDLHYYPADLNEKKDHPSGSTKQGSDIQYYLPDTTHTSGKVVGQAQLNEVFARVSKILDTYQKKEKTWEEEKRKLQAEIQMLRNGKQMK